MSYERRPSVPVRATVAAGATAVGVVLLVSFQPPDQASTHLVRPAALPAATSPPAAGTPTPAPTAAASGAPPSPTAATQAGYRNGTFTGQDVPNQFGDVQVQVVISGGKITDVQAVQLPNDRPRSAFISEQAGPMLHDEVIQAQSAQIDGVSGATYTSESYAESVQSALDQAH